MTLDILPYLHFETMKRRRDLSGGSVLGDLSIVMPIRRSATHAQIRHRLIIDIGQAFSSGPIAANGGFVISLEIDASSIAAAM